MAISAVRSAMMSASEANALNTLFHFLGINTAWAGGPPAPSADHAMHAAGLLAERANRVLMAGVGADDVARCWPKLVAALTAASQASPTCEVCGRAKESDAGGFLVCPDDTDEHEERAAALRG